MEQPKSDERIDRERDFHNNRFSEENRDAQGKYYAAIKDGALLFEQRLRELAKNADVLEYGCGSDCMTHRIATNSRTVSGIDISEVAISLCDEKSATLGLKNTTFSVMNAEAMDFKNGSFDLVFGRGIIHHLDIERSFSEISRVLRTSGTALFWEPLGHNKLINCYRNKTPESRTIDEHPLLKKDFDIAQRYFETVDIKFYGLMTFLSVPFRDSNFGNRLLKITSAIDQMLFSVPIFKWQAWYCLIEMKNPRPHVDAARKS